MDEALKAVASLSKLNVWVLFGVLIGALAHRWISDYLGGEIDGHKIELKDVMLLGGAAASVLKGIYDSTIYLPFINPSVRKREFRRRLLENKRIEKRKILSSVASEEVRKEIVLAYLLPGKNIKSDDD